MITEMFWPSFLLSDIPWKAQQLHWVVSVFGRDLTSTFATTTQYKATKKKKKEFSKITQNHDYWKTCGPINKFVEKAEEAGGRLETEYWLLLDF